LEIKYFFFVVVFFFFEENIEFFFFFLKLTSYGGNLSFTVSYAGRDLDASFRLNIDVRIMVKKKIIFKKIMLNALI
jgi:hypothetical protein